MMRSSIVPAALVLAILGLSGCSGYYGPAQAMYEVKGKVTYNGAPVDRVTMTFIPLEPGKGREDVCAVNKGEYTNKVFAGRYKLTFESGTGGTRLPKHLASAATTKYEIDATKDGETDFELK
jgi:hypothetical protein